MSVLKKLAQYKYPLLMLAVGLLLMLLPSSSGKSAPEPDESCELSALLESAAGVGAARVLLSEHGVIVVCEGADSAAVKMDIIRAVGSYTGFGSDKITILRLADYEMGRKGT